MIQTLKQRQKLRNQTSRSLHLLHMSDTPAAAQINPQALKSHKPQAASGCDILPKRTLTAISDLRPVILTPQPATRNPKRRPLPLSGLRSGLAPWRASPRPPQNWFPPEKIEEPPVRHVRQSAEGMEQGRQEGDVDDGELKVDVGIRPARQIPGLRYGVWGSRPSG